MIPVKRGRLAWVDKRHVAPEILSKLRDTFTLYTDKGSEYGGEESLITAYEENTQYFGFPREAMSQVLRDAELSVEDETILSKPARFMVRKEPWDNQVAPVRETVDLVRRDGGTILQAPCGTGKTNMALYVAAEIQQPTLVFVNKGFLMEQWVSRAEEVLGIKAGIIQQNKCQYKNKKLSVAMVQSLASREDYPADMFNHFGLIIVDECHNLGCRSYDMAMRKFPGRYRLGLSATPRRKDGMDCLFHWHLGPVGVRLETEAKKGKVYQFRLKNSVNMKRYEWGGRLNFSRMINALAALDHRQLFLAQELLKLAQNNRKVLVLSDRKAQLEDFHKRLESNGFHNMGYYVGGMTQKALNESSKKGIILGTYQMAKEGLDIPELDTVVLATPKSDIEQAVGRILRESAGKKAPLVIDVIDPTPILIQMARKRARQYKESGSMDFEVTQIKL